MVYHDWLCGMGEAATLYVRDLCHRRRADMTQQITVLYETAQDSPRGDFLAALELAMYGAEYVQAILSLPHPDVPLASHAQEIHSMLLTQSTVEKTIELLTFDKATDQLDLLTILLGRVLQIREGEETSDAIERELQQIVQVTLKKFISTEHEEIKETALMIIRNLPIRSIKEREIVLKVEKEGNSHLIQQACAAALAEASSRTSPAIEKP